jgi:SanA protein
MLSRIFRLLMTGFFAVILFFVACNVWVIMSSSGRVFTELNDVPSTEVGLVLGTSRRFANGQPNSYFEHRMDAAARLFRDGKVKHLILSGDNRTRYYNEPADMQKALIRRGVPDSAITTDNAGLRTLDSVVRSNKIFGKREIIVITQRFHSYRAVFIGQYYDINTYAYAAETLPVRSSANLLFREFLARPMAVIDLYVLKKDPPDLEKTKVMTF